MDHVDDTFVHFLLTAKGFPHKLEEPFLKLEEKAGDGNYIEMRTFL
jgi:hypothetical protein